MKVLIVSERSTSFLERYITNLAIALIEQQSEVMLLTGEPFQKTIPHLATLFSEVFAELSKTMDEHRYLEVFRLAHQHSVDLIHFCFLVDPQRLFLALDTDAGAFKISYSIFGLADYLKKPIYRNFHEKMLNYDSIHKILIHSDNPVVASLTAKGEHILDSPKVSFVHDPLYDERDIFAMTLSEARRCLGLSPDRKIILYFGTFFYKKGADLLLTAVEQFADDPAIQFVFAGSTRTAPEGFSKASFANKPHITFDDQFIDDARMGCYFAAADLIVLPYRRFYEHDTSGVLVQASLARKPILVPDISPFKETVNEHRLGTTFICENVTDLVAQIKRFFENKHEMDYGWDAYIASIEPWSTLAKLITS